MIKLVSLEPIILEGNTIQMYSSSDKVPWMYLNFKKFIEKNGLQLGDDIEECIKRSVAGITPIRPKPTEEQKNTKPRGLFAT